MLTSFLSTATPGSLSDLLSAASDFLTWCITSMGSLITFIVSNPILLIMVIVFFVSFAVGLIIRMIGGISMR